jgi:hypothetical protein
LSPFHKYRLDLCFDTKPTFHLVVPTKQKLIKECEPKSTDSVIIKQIKESLKENLNQYFKTTEHHLIATMLFPPLKHLNNLYTDEERISAINSLKSMIENINIPSTTTLTPVEPRDQFNECLLEF